MKRVLLDQGTPVPLRGYLSAHRVDTAFEMGWSTLTNGGLLAKAEAAGYSVLVTTDKNLRDQQNLAGRSIAVVVLGTTSWPRLRDSVDDICRAIDTSISGGYLEVQTR